MNMLSKLKKKSAASDPVTTDANGTDLLGDLSPLAGLAAPIRAHCGEHRKILDALGKARFALRYQKDASPPEMRLAVQRVSCSPRSG